jgi:acetyltransferase-like isoleucine patch superfamily enzyme
MDAMNARWATLIDPSAAIGIGSTVGEGCVFRKHAVAGVNATIGNHVILGYSAHVSHDSRIGDYCTLCGHVDVNGGAVVGEGAFLGSHACVLPKIRVGDWAIVGAGSVAARDVLGASTVFGVPGKTAIHGKRKAS